MLLIDLLKSHKLVTSNKTKQDIKQCCASCGTFGFPCEADDIEYGTNCENYEAINPNLVLQRLNWFGMKNFKNAVSLSDMFGFANPGECYKNAKDVMCASNHPEILFVLGVVDAVAHAWIELDDKVFDVSYAIMMPKDEYYNLMNVSHNRKYTFNEFSEKVNSGDNRPSRWDPIVAKYQDKKY